MMCMSVMSQEPPATLKDLNFQQVFMGPEGENSVVSTVPPSPSRIFKEGEADWINADVGDHSLSILLGHLEVPAKTSSSNVGSDLSREVDAQLGSVMTECSMDFAANISDLAASVFNKYTLKSPPKTITNRTIPVYSQRALNDLRAIPTTSLHSDRRKIYGSIGSEFSLLPKR